MNQDTGIVDLLAPLSLPDSLKKEVLRFNETVSTAFADRMLSITITGSAASSDFMPGASDINILVVFKQLDLKDLLDIAPQVNKQWRRHDLSPRFISKRNLEDAAKYFPIDYWTMSQRRVVIFGRDILGEIDFKPQELAWQLRHELNGLRMRVKQRFWRVYGSRKSAKCQLTNAFGSILVHIRVLLHLKGLAVPDDYAGLVDQAASELGISRNDCDLLLKAKQDKLVVKKPDIFPLFESLMEIIRILDDAAGSLQL